MIIDFTQVLKDLDGKPIRGKKIVEDGKVVGDEDATLRFICSDVLLAELQDEKSSGEDKIRRYELAKAIYNCDEMDLKVEDIALIKRRVGKIHFPLIVGITSEMLEGKTDVGTNNPTDDVEVGD